MEGLLIALVDPCRFLGRPSAAVWLIKTVFNLRKKLFNGKYILLALSYALTETDKLSYKFGLFEKKKILIIVIKHS
jgi:hypothetical protein